jgi:hypothetical protein
VPMRRPKATVLALAVVGTVLLSTGLAVAAAPVSGSIAGPVTALEGQTFTVKTSLSPTGSSKVSVSSATVITEQTTGSRADLRKGVCAVAVGQKNGKGVIQAMRVTLSAPVKGRCGAGLGGGRPQGSRPRAGSRPPQTAYGRPPAGLANVGFAAGGISAVTGSTLTLHNQQGTSTVTVSSKTQIVRTVRVDASAVKVGMCAFVQGTSGDKAVRVTAQDISLSKPGPNGCTPGFRRP